MGKVVEIDCEKSMKLETSRNVTKSKRSLHWCRSISKYICARFITVSVKKLLHYRAGGLLQYRAVLLHYRAVITVSGVFITLSGVYYIIGWYKASMLKQDRTCLDGLQGEPKKGASECLWPVMRTYLMI